MNKWIIEPLYDEIIGWTIYNTNNTDKEHKEESEVVAIIPIANNVEAAKSNTALISNAPELLDICIKALEYVDITSDLYRDMESIINKALCIEDLDENLLCFD